MDADQSVNYHKTDVQVSTGVVPKGEDVAVYEAVDRAADVSVNGVSGNLQSEEHRTGKFSTWLVLLGLIVLLVLGFGGKTWYQWRQSFYRLSAADTRQVTNQTLPLSTIPNTSQAVSAPNTEMVQASLGQPVIIDLQLQNHSQVPAVVFESQAVAVYLDYNPLKTLNLPFSRPELLQVLTLSHAQLQQLPPEIGTLQNLQVLHLHFNELAQLPAETSSLTSLTELKLDHNQLIGLPAGFSGLASLETLSLDSNQLSDLPQDIGNVRSLKTLTVSENNIALLPESLGQLSQLERLELRANQLGFVPDSIGQLRSLRVLDLSQNQLSSLPASLRQLTQLERLYLGGNLINPAEIEVLRQELPDTVIFE